MVYKGRSCSLFLGFCLMLSGCGDDEKTETIVISPPNPDQVILYVSAEDIPSDGLVLVNGDDQKHIALDGLQELFLVGQGEEYSVTAAQQPLGYECVVDNGSGVATGSDVRNIRVSCSDVDSAPYLPPVARLSFPKNNLMALGFSVVEFDGQPVNVDMQVQSVPAGSQFITAPSTAYSWTKNQPFKADEFPEVIESIYLLEFSADTLGEYIFEVTASDGNQASQISIVVELTNSEPQIYYNISPYSPRSTDTLTVTNISIFDQESDPVTIDIQWFVNDVFIVEGDQSTPLPSSAIVGGDRVRLVLTAFDTVNTVTRESEITINDTVGRISLSNMPVSAAANSTVNFSVLWDDPDNEPFPADLQMDGPIGATMDATGNVSWTTPTNLIFPNQESFFRFYLPQPTDVEAVTGNVFIESPSSGMIARSGILIDDSYNAAELIRVAKVNGQDRLILSDGRQLLYSLANAEGEFYQDWLHPHDLNHDSTISSLAVFDFNADNVDDIVFAEGDWVYVLDGDTKSILFSVELPSDVLDLKVADLNGNSNGEIVVLSRNNNYSSQRTVSVLTVGEVEPIASFSALGEAMRMVIGNVDSDPQLEIVLNDGSVFDGSSFGNQWAYASDFAPKIALADVDGNGIQEIIGYNTSSYEGYIRIYNANARSLVLAQNRNHCALTALDFTADVGDELLVGDCSTAPITALSFNGVQLEAAFTSSESYREVREIVAGNLDADPEIELIIKGQSPDYRDVVMAIDTTKTPEMEWSSAAHYLLNGFIALGQDDTDNNPLLIARDSYLSPANRGAALVKLDLAGTQLRVLGHLPRASLAYDSILADVDDDAVDEIVVGYSSSYCDVLSGTTLVQETQIGAGVCSQLTSVDVNDDGVKEVLFIRQGQLHIRNLKEEISLFVSNVNDQVNSYTVLNRDSDPELEVAIGGYFGIKIYDYVVGAYAEVESSDQEHYVWRGIDADNDGIDELITTRESNTLNVYKALDASPFISINVPEGVGDIVVPSTTLFDQQFILASQGQNYGQGSRIISYSYSGIKNWQSAPLIGRVTKGGLVAPDNASAPYDLLIGTDKVMYVIR